MLEGSLSEAPLNRGMDSGAFFLDDALDSVLDFIECLFYCQRKYGDYLRKKEDINRAEFIRVRGGYVNSSYGLSFVCKGAIIKDLMPDLMSSFSTMAGDGVRLRSLMRTTLSSFTAFS